MSSTLTLTPSYLEEKGAGNTAAEIIQQPECWDETLAKIDDEGDKLRSWLKTIQKQSGVRIILTGAGTSAYIGDSLAPLLRAQTNLRVESIPTTHLVAQPASYLDTDTPTLLVSFARSGNSPESTAAVDLATTLLGDNVSHLAVTCSSEGALAKQVNRNANGRVFHLPARCNDRGFAMTGSFTSMVIAVAALFMPDTASTVQRAAHGVRPLLERDWSERDLQTHTPFSRVIFLGAGSLYGFAREAALKTLELSAGQLPAFCETPLGFRHGPKSLIDGQTLVVVMRSSDAYTQKYDDDLVDELRRDNVAAHVEVLDEPDAAGHDLGDLQAGLYAIVWCQILAFLNSLSSGITPDNPSPSGHVNRVVQGVHIHPYR